MIIAAHQPNFLPNLAFFSKMKEVDLFVIITNIQFEKHEGWQQRHKIKGPNNDLWLTVPVLGSQNQLIKDVIINNNINWRRKHKNSLLSIFSNKKERIVLSDFLNLFNRDWKNLADLNIAIIQYLKDLLRIRTPIAVDNEVSGGKHKLIINICKKYNGSLYLSGVGAKEYLTNKRLDEMKENGIDHMFVSRNLTLQYPYSTIDYLFRFGKEWVMDVI